MSTATVIVGYARTPIGCFQGALSSVSAIKLGQVAIKEALRRSLLSADRVEEVIMGEVLSAGVGQAPARQAALGAGIGKSAACLTVNKVCGSGLKAVMLADDSIALGRANVVVAGGMESMSNAPYLLPSARAGMRMGNQKVVDSMLQDGLIDPYSATHMGNFGEKCAREFKYSREDQDRFTQKSYEKALSSIEKGYFADEIVPVSVTSRKKTFLVEQDEEPGRFNKEKISKLRPVFHEDGTITAANASKINDGAAALVLMNEQAALASEIKPLAQIVSSATFAGEPEWFTTAPIGAIKKALAKAELSVDDIDLFEINEAFSVVTMAAANELCLDESRVNVRGGAVALGHPIGCSGARVLVTLLSTMIQRDVKRGCAALCIGGGEAVAMIIER